jgi:serine O-acetyltransferase
MAETTSDREQMVSIVAELSGFSERSAAMARHLPCTHPLPDRAAMVKIIEELRSILFPGYFGGAKDSRENLYFHVGATLDSVGRALEVQIRRALCFHCTQPEMVTSCIRQASAGARQFTQRLPAIQEMLHDDVEAVFEGDPACISPDEAILAYPGLYAVSCYRIAHELFVLEVPLLPRIITEIAHSDTGIDIHPGARIGRRFFIDHGTGVVIGATCILGDRVRIYQGVTLGAKSFQLDEEGRPVKGVPRHPILEDDVIIYAGATILGRVTIGKGSVIGGNVWLTRSVPAGSQVSQSAVRFDSFHSGDGI